ncbi:hypothetical protein K2X85_19965 [bacterium]|nr:hypothetical protein [bacterium]
MTARIGTFLPLRTYRDPSDGPNGLCFAPFFNAQDEAGATSPRSRSILAKICANNRLGTATSANWKVM